MYVKVNFGRFFRKKNAPRRTKMYPNGEISPNLVSLLAWAKPEMKTSTENLESRVARFFGTN
jgi:hypothetical protein